MAARESGRPYNDSAATMPFSGRPCVRELHVILLKVALLRNSWVQIDLWGTADTALIAHIIGRTITQQPRYTRITPEAEPASRFSLVFHLERTVLQEAASDSGDVIEELQSTFPGLLAMTLLDSAPGQYDDVLCVQLKEGFDHVTYWEFMELLDSMLPMCTYDGLVAEVSGDISAFWGPYRPTDYDSEGVKLLPGSDLIKLLSPSYHPTSDGCLATVSKTKLALNVKSIEGGSLPTELCVACKTIIIVADAVRTPGDTYCCQACHERLFFVCCICTESIHKLTARRVACGHMYCQDCLIHRFRSGTSMLHNFPPKCCDRVLLPHQHLDVLPHDTVRTYMELEEARKADENVRCATKTCEQRTISYLHVKDGWALCSICFDLTCSRCGALQAEHENGDSYFAKCPVDNDALLQLAESEGWKACPGCHNMVERNGGCNTMTCLCGQEFCYISGEPCLGQGDYNAFLHYQGYEPGIHPYYVDENEEEVEELE